MAQPIESLRKHALTFPDTSEGVACEGTKLEKRTIKVGAKAFLFLGPADAMLKLKASLAEAKRLAKRAPDRVRAGATGWVTVTVRGDAVTPAALLRKWARESYDLAAPAKPAKARAKAR